jgi:hypothetical protein
MAILHRATITPSKAELVEQWLDRQPWGGDGEVEIVGAYRFDDPEGEVGIEAFVVRRESRLLHAAMTYRGAPLEGAEEWLVGTMEHSVLGQRWIYDARHDPVAVACFERALAGDQAQASLELYDGDQLVARRDPGVVLHRREVPGTAVGALHLATDLAESLEGREQLVATWTGGEAVVAAR